MSIYTITSVNGRREFESKYGPLVSYKLTITGDDGYEGEAEMTRKPESTAPQQGEQVEGTLDKSNPKYPPKLKRAPGGSPGGVARSGGGRTSKDSESIERQVAFKGAVELIAAMIGPKERVPEDEVCELMTAYFTHGLSLIQNKAPMADPVAAIKETFKAVEVEQPVTDKELGDAYRKWSAGQAAVGVDQNESHKRIQQKKLALGINEMADASNEQRQAFLSFLTDDV